MLGTSLLLSSRMLNLVRCGRTFEGSPGNKPHLFHLCSNTALTSTNNQYKANMLANQFQATCSNENFTNKFQNNLQSVSLQLHQKLHHCTYKKIEFNASFNMNELEDALVKSKNSAVSNDKLKCEMLKHMPYRCLQILLLLFNWT